MLMLSRNRALFCAAALPALLFGVLLSDVDSNDARRALNDLAEPPGNSVQVGYLYSVNRDGLIDARSPACQPDSALLKTAVFEKETDYVLRNRLGYALPTATDWLVGIVSFGVVDAGFSGPTEDFAELRHTRWFKPLTERFIRSWTAQRRLIAAQTTGDPECSAAIDEAYDRGKCVAMVTYVATIDDALIGYKTNEMCYVPKRDVYDGRSNEVPPRSRKMLEHLSDLKHRLGLLITEVVV